MRLIVADLLGEVSEKRAGNELAAAMKMIGDAGQGVVVVLREASASSLTAMVSQKSWRKLMVGQIVNCAITCRCANIDGPWCQSDGSVVEYPPNVVSLEGYDLAIIDWQPLQQES